MPSVFPPGIHFVEIQGVFDDRDDAELSDARDGCRLKLCPGGSWLWMPRSIACEVASAISPPNQGWMTGL
jgi:hypothetical protein